MYKNLLTSSLNPSALAVVIQRAPTNTLSGNSKIILLAWLDYLRVANLFHTEWNFLDMRMLAIKLGISVTSIQRILARLCKQGVLEKQVKFVAKQKRMRVRFTLAFLQSPDEFLTKIGRASSEQNNLRTFSS